MLSATPARLTSASGNDPAAVRDIRDFAEAMNAALRSRLARGPVLPDMTALLDHLRSSNAWLRREQVRLLHFDHQLALLHDEVIAEGTLDEAAIYAREVVRRAIDLGSRALILVHNHPSGDPTPSAADVAVTRQVAEACRLFRITLYDHVIVAGGGHASLRQMGLL